MKCERCSDSRGTSSFVCCKCKAIVTDQAERETCPYCRFWHYIPDQRVFGKPMRGWGECQHGEKIYDEMVDAGTGKGGAWTMTYQSTWCEHFEPYKLDPVTGRRVN